MKFGHFAAIGNAIRFHSSDIDLFHSSLRETAGAKQSLQFERKASIMSLMVSSGVRHSYQPYSLPYASIESWNSVNAIAIIGPSNGAYVLNETFPLSADRTHSLTRGTLTS